MYKKKTEMGAFISVFSLKVRLLFDNCKVRSSLKKRIVPCIVYTKTLKQNFKLHLSKRTK